MASTLIDRFMDDGWSKIDVLTEMVNRQAVNLGTLVTPLDKNFRVEALETNKVGFFRSTGKLELVPMKDPEADGDPTKPPEEALFEFKVPHFPLRDRLTASMLQNASDRGLKPPSNMGMSTSGKMSFNQQRTQVGSPELVGVRQAVFTIFGRQLRRLKFTGLHTKLNAVHGQINDHDGSKYLNLHEKLGINRLEFYLDLDNNADVPGQCDDIALQIGEEAQGTPYTGITVHVDLLFLGKLKKNPSVIKEFEDDKPALRGRSVTLGDITFELMSLRSPKPDGSVRKWIPENTGYGFLTGDGIYPLAYSPGNYIDAVNKKAVPFYPDLEKVGRKAIDVSLQTNVVAFSEVPETQFTVHAGTEPAP